MDKEKVLLRLDYQRISESLKEDCICQFKSEPLIN